MRPIILNSTHLIDDGFQNKYKFKFSPNMVVKKGDTISVSSINLYYSWFNITDSSVGGKYNNNVFYYIWPYTITGGVNTSETKVEITPGYYNASTLNTFLQKIMVDKGHYLVDSTGQFLYYLQITENATYYAIEFQNFTVPNTIGTNVLPNASNGSPSWAFPGSGITSICPQFVVPSTNNFGTLVGFSAGTYPFTVANIATNYYPSTASTSNTSTISDITPQLSPVSCILVDCNLVNNPYTVPRGLIYAITPVDTDFGAMISSQPTVESFVQMFPGSHQELIITLKDQLNNDIAVGDSNLVIILNIQSVE